MSNRIQYISIEAKKNQVENVVFSSFKEPCSLDEFDINIIDLNNALVWQGVHQRGGAGIYCENDLLSIRTMIENASKTKVVVLLPKDMEYKYDYEYLNYTKSYKYNQSKKLKDAIDFMMDVLFNKVLPCQIHMPGGILYENTRTKIGEDTINASFYFKPEIANNSLAVSDISQKTTTISLSDMMTMGARLR